jgi:hypothetical protein
MDAIFPTYRYAKQARRPGCRGVRLARGIPAVNRIDRLARSR